MAQAESLPLDLLDIRVRLRRLPRFDVAAPGDDVPEGWDRARTVNGYRQLLEDAARLVAEVERLRGEPPDDGTDARARG